METTILYRPVGPKELALIAASGYHQFPPRLPEQPIFYPVLNEEYARQIAREWNVSASGGGYVTRFYCTQEMPNLSSTPGTTAIGLTAGMERA